MLDFFPMTSLARFFLWPPLYDFFAVFAEQEFVLEIAQPAPPKKK